MSYILNCVGQSVLAKFLVSQALKCELWVLPALRGYAVFKIVFARKSSCYYRVRWATRSHWYIERRSNNFSRITLECSDKSLNAGCWADVTQSTIGGGQFYFILSCLLVDGVLVWGRVGHRIVAISGGGIVSWFEFSVLPVLSHTPYCQNVFCWLHLYNWGVYRPAEVGHLDLERSRSNFSRITFECSNKSLSAGCWADVTQSTIGRGQFYFVLSCLLIDGVLVWGRVGHRIVAISRGGIVGWFEFSVLPVLSYRNLV